MATEATTIEVTKDDKAKIKELQAVMIEELGYFVSQRTALMILVNDKLS